MEPISLYLDPDLGFFSNEDPDSRLCVSIKIKKMFKRTKHYGSEKHVLSVESVNGEFFSSI